MQISVSITADADDKLPEPDEIAERVLDALDGDPDSDHCSVFVTPPTKQGLAGTMQPPPLPDSPPPPPLTPPE